MNALPSTADVDAGKIIVRASLGDLMICSRIPGAKWDTARKAWSFPATAATATLLRKKLRGVAESDRFKLILATSVTIKLDREQAPALVAGEGIPGNVIPLKPPVPGTLPVPAPDVILLPPPQESEIVVELPPGLRTKPWRHQRVAYKFCLDHFAQGLHGILLAMGMGTGKSLVACLLLLGLAAKRVLICCPLRVVPVWLTQFDRHVAVDLVVVPLDAEIGSVANKMELAEGKLRLAEARGVPFVAVINYDSAWRDPFATWAEKQRWDLVIADEAHRIKAPGGKASMFFKRLRTKAMHRVLLTGTPMPHGPMDIFAPMRFADITIFGPSFSAFRQKYAVMGGYLRKQITGFQKLDELERLMSRVTYRVGKEVLDLPPETDVTYHCDLGGEARRIYEDIEDDFVAQVRDGIVTAANAMVKLVRLQQVANGIAKTDDGVEQRIDNSKQQAPCGYPGGHRRGRARGGVLPVPRRPRRHPRKLPGVAGRPH